MNENAKAVPLVDADRRAVGEGIPHSVAESGGNLPATHEKYANQLISKL